VAATDDRAGSTVVMARVHGRLLAYAADEDASVVRILDVETPRELGSVPVPGKPGRMSMLSGGRLAVTLRDQAKVALYTPSPIGEAGLDPLCSLDTPDEPVDLAATPDEKTLLVLSDWGHALTAFDLDEGKPRATVDLPRSPRAVLVAADGKHAYVAHAAGRAMSAVDLRAQALASEPIVLAGRSTDREVFFEMMPMPPADFFVDSFAHVPHHRPPAPRSTARTRERSACQGFALAELAGPSPRVFAPIVEVVTGDLEVQSSGYGPGASTTPEIAAVAVVDESTGKPVGASLAVREPDSAAPKPCLLPRAAAVSGASLYVACMGIDAVVEYDVSNERGETRERRRWSVASGPTGIAVHGSRAVVWSQFGGEATVLSLGRGAEKDPGVRVPGDLRPRGADDETIALGRALFHASSDLRISSDGRACASCHPGGRDDGLVWSTPGGPRQTPMLAGRLPDAAPYGWDGAGSDVAHHLGHTFARLEGQGLPPRELDALVRYVTTLGGPSVHEAREAGAFERLARGREVFFSAGCGSCHSPESGWADGARHAVKSQAAGDAVDSFDTPSLRFVSGTAPYFHDGRYATLRDLLASQEGPMGAARGRSPEELADLEAFVRSL
jgi:DNA-binding beta-propeller fold protein YncE